MSTSISVSAKKRGRPRTTGTPKTIGVRVHDETIVGLDGYIAKQPEPLPSRSEMIRKILEDRLVHEGFIQPQPGVGTTT